MVILLKNFPRYRLLAEATLFGLEKKSLLNELFKKDWNLMVAILLFTNQVLTAIAYAIPFEILIRSPSIGQLPSRTGF